MKGIVLAGGAGTRLGSLTRAASKQLLPVYDLPMVVYPLRVLMLAGIREILVITTPEEEGRFRHVLSGSLSGVSLSYAVQPSPAGIAQALTIAEDCGFLRGEPCTLILGDNVFLGGAENYLAPFVRVANILSGAVLFTKTVPDPERFGVVELDAEGSVLSIEEKPKEPKSRTIATGLYCYDENAARLVRLLKPSARGEIEITDLNRLYLAEGRLQAVQLYGVDWYDCGTPDSLLDAGIAVRGHR